MINTWLKEWPLYWPLRPTSHAVLVTHSQIVPVELSCTPGLTVFRSEPFSAVWLYATHLLHKLISCGEANGLTPTEAGAGERCQGERPAFSAATENTRPFGSRTRLTLDSVAHLNSGDVAHVFNPPTTSPPGKVPCSTEAPTPAGTNFFALPSTVPLTPTEILTYGGILKTSIHLSPKIHK